MYKVLLRKAAKAGMLVPEYIRFVLLMELREEIFDEARIFGPKLFSGQNIKKARR
jgi:hypothetical protein